MEDRARRKELTGVVVSDGMDKTIIVRVDRIIKHPLYEKRIKRDKRFKVHDEKNEAKKGQKVKIMETRPLSKEKRWRLVEVIK
ncbi:MAG: 30S ribosomal protein S17 [Candidatus Kaelpia aquatica]|nr:30S ribosomal protein S17 [Candidatus Kaelpia aquatica]